MKTAEEILKKYVWQDFENGRNVCETDAIMAMKEYAIQQNKTLLTALERIVDPIKYMRENLKEGEILNEHFAHQLSVSAMYLREIAENALRNYQDDNT